MDQGADSPKDFIPPWIWLLSSLDATLDEHEVWYAGPETEQEFATHRALDEVSEFALEFLRSGQVPTGLRAKLAEYQPWVPVEDRVQELITYDYVVRRIEFEAAREVIENLENCDKRVFVSIAAAMDLRRVTLSPTADKYLRQVSKLYLAGYVTEVFVMAAAVLEAAMRERLSDDFLKSLGMKPHYTKTGVFSIGQRMQVEARPSHAFFMAADRKLFWNVMNWRNDAVHNQPDMVPNPAVVVLLVAKLLGGILPRTNI